MGRDVTGARFAGSAPIDVASLVRNTAGNRGLEREVLGIFREQIGQYLAALESAVDNASAWRQAAHTLKGAARSIGANEVAQLAETAESGVMPAAQPRLLDEIRRAAQEARRFIDYRLLDSAH